MRKLIILSDLWGRERANWVKHYEERLNTNYKVVFYDSCQLGEIDLSVFDEQSIHEQFKKTGIENAVNSLLKVEKQTIDIAIGFSIGGTILWKAILKGLKVKRLIGISATRLRLESRKIPCSSKLYFGLLDQYKPSAEWLETMPTDYEVLENRHHDMYKNENIADLIVNELLLLK